MRFLPSCGCVSITEQIHHLDTNETFGENLDCNYTRMVCVVVEATLLKAAVVWPLASHLTNHSNKTNRDRQGTAGKTRTDSFEKYSHERTFPVLAD